MPGEWVNKYQAFQRKLLICKVGHFLIVFTLKSNNNILTKENLENIEKHKKEIFRNQTISQHPENNL